MNSNVSTVWGKGTGRTKSLLLKRTRVWRASTKNSKKWKFKLRNKSKPQIFKTWVNWQTIVKDNWVLMKRRPMMMKGRIITSKTTRTKNRIQRMKKETAKKTQQ